MKSAVHAVVGLAVCLLASACIAVGPRIEPAPPPPRSTPDAETATGLRGSLLLIGGALDDDNAPVYERLIELAKAAAAPADRDAPRIVIATAASLNQEPAAESKVRTIRRYCPTAVLGAITRETPEAETIALIDAASALFFTGGDQKRIIDRYRPAGIDTAEATAMRRLLARGGVIAGTSAGDAMMGPVMFHTGRSAEALGVRSTRREPGPDDDADERRAEIPLGPQIGPGMDLLPWAMTDSHFFERHRFGRLVAAQEVSGTRLGIGVGEDACAEVDLATGELSGISAAGSLLVDVGGLLREGPARRGIRARVIAQGTRVSLTDLLASAPFPPPPADSATLAHPAPRPEQTVEFEAGEPGRSRALTSWRFFLRAEAPPSPASPATAQALRLDGYAQFAWPDGSGWSIVDIEPRTP